MAPPIATGIEALNAFLQANVTGPVLADDQTKLADPYRGSSTIDLGLRSLDVDGVSVYPFIPHIELFCLARHVVEHATPEEWKGVKDEVAGGMSLAWMKLRLHVWHYKLFIQPSLSSGSVFTKHVGMSEVPSLVEKIQSSLQQVESDVLGEAWELSEASPYSTETKVLFMVEKASVCIMLGQDVKAREALKHAAELHGFVYALSGALGKRTRFQEKSTSQLVVLAKSAAVQREQPEKLEGEGEVPEALALNDDTLLEEIEFSKDGEGKHGEQNGPAVGTVPELPAQLTDMKPDEQPQLSPLDQIILLTEATLKDAFSPADTLTSEEILPFAVRVVNDKSTNWQIYTQALLVRSRIEMHRSRTIERGVLQMQAVVDQVIADTTRKATEDGKTANDAPNADQLGIPEIAVSAADEEDAMPKPRRNREEAAPVNEQPGSFFPAAKATDSAPAHVRLQYIHALSSPPRWHLESELAYAWTGVGSLVSALEIFKRLKLWAEVALCLASSAALDDQDGSGRGGGGEEKARAIVRWRLFHRKDRPNDLIDEDTDISTLRAIAYSGPERTPAQPNAPRLFCILGDLESDSAVAHYERAWEISKHRYARAQKSLGEHYLAERDWPKAREAYKLAVSVNRIAPDLWNRLGDINLRMGQFADAAEAFTRAIGSANDTAGGEDARTWSNLGSALYSLYLEALGEESKGKEQPNGTDNKEDKNSHQADDDDEDGDRSQVATSKSRKDPSMLLAQSMNAYKRGAATAGDNWRIWDNVITLATRMKPMPFFEVIQALRSIIRIKNSESSLDADILRLLLAEGVLSQEKKNDTGAGLYEPPRGSVERNVNEMMEKDIVPLITNRSELWELMSRLRVWRRDYAGAVDASEKAWRTAIGGATSGAGSMGGGLTVESAKKTDGDGSKIGNWLEDRDAWQTVVQRTDELVALLEKYGPEVPEVGEKWKGKARSAIRSVMGKGKESWEGSEGWETLKGLMEGLKSS